jgi:NTE family protein
MSAGGGEDEGLVLAGAVAKGAFEIGAAQVLARRPRRITRVAATSSGALNAAILGAGLAFDHFSTAVDVATELWKEEGSWAGIAHVSLGALVHLEGVLDTTKLAALVKRGITEVAQRAGAGTQTPADPLKVTLITADLRGLRGEGALPTYERPLQFTATDFRDPARWDAIATAAAASASFPGLFSPTLIDGGPCVDGGAVNNAPISYLLDNESAIASVITITAQPLAPDPVSPALGGANLISHLADALTNERLSRDLLQAQKTNARLQAVEDAMTKAHVSAEAAQAIRIALGWRHLRQTLICPATLLPGTSFAGFGDAQLRAAYIAAGVDAAEKSLQ